MVADWLIRGHREAPHRRRRYPEEPRDGKARLSRKRKAVARYLVLSGTRPSAGDACTDVSGGCGRGRPAPHRTAGVTAQGRSDHGWGEWYVYVYIRMYSHVCVIHVSVYMYIRVCVRDVTATRIYDAATKIDAISPTRFPKRFSGFTRGYLFATMTTRQSA